MSTVHPAFDKMFPDLLESLASIHRPPMRRDLIDGIQFDGIDYSDAPDFVDAFICSADYNGKPMTSDQLDEINDDSDFVYERLQEHIY